MQARLVAIPYSMVRRTELREAVLDRGNPQVVREVLAALAAPATTAEVVRMGQMQVVTTVVPEEVAAAPPDQQRSDQTAQVQPEEAAAVPEEVLGELSIPTEVQVRIGLSIRQITGLVVAAVAALVELTVALRRQK